MREMQVTCFSRLRHDLNCSKKLDQKGGTSTSQRQGMFDHVKQFGTGPLDPSFSTNRRVKLLTSIREIRLRASVQISPPFCILHASIRVMNYGRRA